MKLYEVFPREEHAEHLKDSAQLQKFEEIKKPMGTSANEIKPEQDTEYACQFMLGKRQYGKVLRLGWHSGRFYDSREEPFKASPDFIALWTDVVGDDE